MKFLFEKANSIIYTGFIILVFFTPLIFYSHTYELFEFNKMMFVYLVTIIVVTFWAIRMVAEKRFIFEKSPLDIPLLLFLIANILSTIFSINQHVSIFGYYSRLNGGLLSTTCYLLLYWSFMANFPREKIKHLLLAIVAGGLLVSLWAIPEHFGIDPSCKILVDSWKADCWIQDVQARVFATLGQPNWLAGYLGMIIPVSLGLLLYEKLFWRKIFYLFSSLSMTLAFIFTFSRGGILGLISGLGLFGALLFVSKKRLSLPKLGSGLVYIIVITIITIIMALVFGTAFNKPIQFLHLNPSSETQSPSQPSNPSSGTQLESGGTETGKIRLIVWRGAIAIWKAYPLVGSGVETFADSYYQYRPVEHNQTTEWDFLYNKAHNEYLNYLATTGAFGFLTYLLLISAFIFYTLKKIWTTSPQYKLVIAGLLGAYLSYLIQNFFGFSVVIIALFFFLYPAIVFKLIGAQEERNPLLSLRGAWRRSNLRLPRLSFLSRLAKTSGSNLQPLYLTTILLAASIMLFGLFRLFSADLKFTDGFKSEGKGGWETSKYLIEQAVILNPLEPFYQSELGYVNSVLATTAVTDSNGQQAAQEAEYWATKATQISPFSLSYWKTLAKIDIDMIGSYTGYEDKALKASLRAAQLAPTEPKVAFNLATLYSQLDKNEEAITWFKKVTSLKTDYREAYLGLARTYELNKQREQAIAVYKDMRKKFPQETEAKIKLKEWTGSED